MQLRTILETMTACEAARNLTEQSLKGLEARLTSMEEAASKRDYFRVAEADLEFHRYIWELSGDQTVRRVLDQIAAPLFATTSMQQSMRSRRLSSHIKAHALVVAVLKRGDSQEIGHTIRAHIGMYQEFIGLRGFHLTEIANPAPGGSGKWSCKLEQKEDYRLLDEAGHEVSAHS